MTIEKLPIFAYYNKQRFTQAGSMDCANWYGVSVPDSKSGQALYPAMGRRHVRLFDQNKLIFTSEPRKIFRSIDFVYVIVGTSVFRVDRFYNSQRLSESISLEGEVWFATLPVGNIVYNMLTDGTDVFVIKEDGTNVSMQKCTDTNRPSKPVYVAAFGNRFVVSTRDTPTATLSQINLGASPDDPSLWFTIEPTGAAFPLFFRATGIIRQFAVLHNQLYILCDFVTDIWSNVPTQINVAGVVREFPWKLNTSYNWDYGIADPNSLDIDFGMMVWLARNRNGLVSFMMSNGQQPQDISSQAIDVLLESQNIDGQLSPFLANESDGFLYQWENSIFYRVSAGKFLDFGDLDIQDSANSIEYNFQTKTWHRAIELNGERNRIQKHVFFNNRHLVTVEGERVVYEMAGNIYYNELRNPNVTDEQADNAFLKSPMRYELVTQQIYQPDYSEFITDYVEIDFVFGDQTFHKSNAPFDNTTYIVAEDGSYLVTEDSVPGDETFIIAEGTNTPAFDDQHYNALFKPHIELYVSDDGGVTFYSADLREFSPLGVYRWRMRWYELGTSRNRCYRLICVSSAPVVILGAVQNTRRASGGAN